MKKVFALLAIASFMVACNNSSESTEPVADTTTVVTPEDVPVDSTTAEVVAPADTTHTH
jgi:hypothetical protein